MRRVDEGGGRAVPTKMQVQMQIDAGKSVRPSRGASYCFDGLSTDPSLPFRPVPCSEFYPVSAHPPAGMYVGVVTFSPQVSMISSVLKAAFPDVASQVRWD